MLTLKALDDEQIRALYENDMRRDFPPSELKRLSDILKMKRKGVYSVLGAYQDDRTLAAYALVYHSPGNRAALLDYLAVRPALRHEGIGSELLTRLRAYYTDVADVLLIECERPKAAPDEAMARKRIGFYTKAGAVLTRVRIWLFDVEYSILVLPCTDVLPACDWAEEMLSLYRQMLTAERFEQNVRLIRG